jgi:uncharacterized membrane protein YccC
MTDLLTFFTDMGGFIVSSWINLLGAWFYGIVFTVVGIYILFKTETWYSASAILILMAILFSAVTPPYVIFLWAIVAALSFAMLIVDVVVLK